MKKAAFTIFVTTKCNLSCKYCYEKDFHKIDMSADVAKKTVAFIKEKIKEQGLTDILVRFHGGETIIRFDIIKYIMDELDDKSCRTLFSMTTNATLITEEMIPTLVRFDALSVSIDGREEEHDKNRVGIDGKGTYSKVYNNAMLLLKHFPNLTARMTITPATYSKVYDNFRSIVELGFKKIDADLDFTSDNWTNEMMAEYLEELKKIANFIKSKEQSGISIESSLIESAAIKAKNSACEGGISSFTITPDGKIYPCTAAAFKEEFLLGTVETGITNDQVLKKIEAVGKKRNDHCEGCARYDYCMVTRCKIFNYAYTGDFYMPKPIMCANEHIKVSMGKYLLN
ncbi:MAG: radical SAM protein [Ruminococcus sp.]|uniref:radical SAM/SPASM domain-containing protein n=1 Tax=Ruminococcus sp. TaxID=41978 RepID=UPI0025CB7F67|nr:radical SAM protein [Ruminococcus sp.]MCR5541240.1 radical SAM protein [Ruminococcus sp.]